MQLEEDIEARRGRALMRLKESMERSKAEAAVRELVDARAGDISVMIIEMDDRETESHQGPVGEGETESSALAQAQARKEPESCDNC